MKSTTVFHWGVEAPNLKLQTFALAIAIRVNKHRDFGSRLVAEYLQEKCNKTA
jgi:hypothetical protein